NIAARIVEIVGGMPYEDFLQKRFFDPLGMNETTFWPTEAQIARLAGAYGPNKEKNGFARGGMGFLTKPFSDRVRRFPEAGGGLFSTTHDVFRYGLMLANDGELDGKRYLSHAAMEELRREQTGATRVNYSLGYHLRKGRFGHDGAYGTDLSVDPKTGMVTIFMVQCTGGDQWAARDRFIETAAQVFLQ
ncbi:MAG TPA: serine hydrolase domain-containing protein, partial [Chthoniobacteraceae bacterium]|nr:serine hydrolase domain-containing protein [Chthoniobacteraceae bacterium]